MINEEIIYIILKSLNMRTWCGLVGGLNNKEICNLAKAFENAMRKEIAAYTANV